MAGMVMSELPWDEGLHCQPESGARLPRLLEIATKGSAFTHAATTHQCTKLESNRLIDLRWHLFCAPNRIHIAPNNVLSPQIQAHLLHAIGAYRPKTQHSIHFGAASHFFWKTRKWTTSNKAQTRCLSCWAP
jgi:hypothetical protein